MAGEKKVIAFDTQEADEIFTDINCLMVLSAQAGGLDWLQRERTVDYYELKLALANLEAALIKADHDEFYKYANELNERIPAAREAHTEYLKLNRVA